MRARELQLLILTILCIGALFPLYKHYNEHTEEISLRLKGLELEYLEYHAKAAQIKVQLAQYNAKPKTEMVILIITAPGNFDFRSQLRNSSYLTQQWKYTAKESFDIAYHFVVGNSQDQAVQAKMREEQALFNDLLIGDFADSYENLVYKTIWLLKYAIKRYEFDFVFKVDDDTFMNLELLFDFLYKFIKPKFNSQGSPYYGGMIRHGPRDVQREGAWGIERWEFEDDILPPYLVGGAYIMNSKAADAITSLISRNEMVAFKIEDAYIGAIANKLGIIPRDIPKTYSKEYDRHCMEKKGKIFHRVAPSFQARMIANWTTHGYYCTHSRSHEELVAAGEELARKY